MNLKKMIVISFSFEIETAKNTDTKKTDHEYSCVRILSFNSIRYFKVPVE